MDAAVRLTGETALFFAAHRGHTAVVEQLLAADAAVDAADEEAVTPLHAAAGSGHAGVVQLRLEARASAAALGGDALAPFS